MAARKTMAEKVWSKIDKLGPDDCWLWKGKKQKKTGYGCVREYHRTPPGKKIKYLQAHREAWKLANKVDSLPSKTMILHSCHNPPCCNPRHLRPGTLQDNVDDMWKAGRAADVSGEKNPRSRLSEKDVLRIRSERERGRTLKSLAEEYSVHLSTIDYAARGVNWKSVV